MSYKKAMKPPRVVVVSRATEYEQLMARHATRQQAAFFLKSRGQSLDDVSRRHSLKTVAMAAISSQVPKAWRRAEVMRADLSRFIFEPSDLVVVVGPDGLVANVAKYLNGQNVIGINPDPANYDGLLVPHVIADIEKLFRAVSADRLETEPRCMVEVTVDDGQRLVALNEIFVGHQSHQSARYKIAWRGSEELQSSSGLIVTTGTGATGWARSIALQRSISPELPKPCEGSLAFFVRESFPSQTTGVEVQSGQLAAQESLVLVSQMNTGGVIFGDGIEEDRIRFHWGMKAEIAIAGSCLHLAVRC